MGQTFYELLVSLLTNDTNRHLSPDLIVSNGLLHIGLFIAYIWLAGTLLWFTRKSVLIARTSTVYLFAAFVGLSGLAQLLQVVYSPDWLVMTVHFLAAGVSLFTAFVMWQRRHFILSIVYQFKYVIGLLKTLERLDEEDDK